MSFFSSLTREFDKLGSSATNTVRSVSSQLNAEVDPKSRWGFKIIDDTVPKQNTPLYLSYSYIGGIFGKSFTHDNEVKRSPVPIGVENQEFDIKFEIGFSQLRAPDIPLIRTCVFVLQDSKSKTYAIRFPPDFPPFLRLTFDGLVFTMSISTIPVAGVAIPPPQQQPIIQVSTKGPPPNTTNTNNTTGLYPQLPPHQQVSYQPVYQTQVYPQQQPYYVYPQHPHYPPQAYPQQPVVYQQVPNNFPPNQYPPNPNVVYVNSNPPTPSPSAPNVTTTTPTPTPTPNNNDIPIDLTTDTQKQSK